MHALSTREFILKTIRPSPRALVTLDLSLDTAQNLLPHLPRGHEQLPILVGTRIAGEGVEEVGDVGNDPGIAGQVPEVRVDTGRDRVVVPRAHVNIATQPFGLAPHHQTHLGVRLETDEAIDDMHAGLLEGAGPDDVVLLIEPGLELYQHRHLLAVFPSLSQGSHDGRIRADTVQSLFDRQHIWIFGRFPTKSTTGLKLS